MWNQEACAIVNHIFTDFYQRRAVIVSVIGWVAVNPAVDDPDKLQSYTILWSLPLSGTSLRALGGGGFFFIPDGSFPLYHQ